MGFCQVSVVDTGPTENTSVMDSDSDSSIYVDSSIQYTIDINSTFPLSSKPSENFVKKVTFKAWTPEWMVQHIKEYLIKKSIINLRLWVSSKCEPEAMEQMVKEIQKLKTKDAISMVESLKDKHQYIQGTKGHDLKFSINVENLENSTTVETKVLLDCGTTGSCINWKFVEKHQLPIQKIPIKILVYNADGSLNANGSIEGYCKLRVMIGDHAKRIEFRVTNLGNTNIFLGLDWLCHHNPNIDWSNSTLSFDHCPAKCGYVPW